jgi:hypothetical protein
MHVILIEISKRKLLPPITCFISPASPVSSASIGEQGQFSGTPTSINFRLHYFFHKR